MCSPEKNFGPDIFDTNFKKVHENKKCPIIYVTEILMTHPSVDSIIVFINKDTSYYLGELLYFLMMRLSLKGDKNLILVTRYKTSNYKSAFNYTMDIRLC